MLWSSDDGPWGEEALGRFVSGGYNGLSLNLPPRPALEDLRFLDDVPGLRFLRVNTKVGDDTAVFSLSGLDSLTLLTGSRRPLPSEPSPGLRRLVLTDRPGIDTIGREPRWPDLVDLQVGMFHREDLGWLTSSPALETLRLEARGQTLELSGLREVPSLRKLVLINAGVNGLEPLADLRHLESLDLMATARGANHGVLDLDSLVGAPIQRLWIAHADGLRHLESLLSVPTLRHCRLIACNLTASDGEVLTRLGARCRLEVEDR